jgi:hypothetical protein
MDHPREVDPKERESGIRDWVDEVSHQEAALRDQFVVFTAEGDDLESRVDPGHSRDSVGLEPAAIYQIATAYFSLGGFEQEFVSLAADSIDPCAGLDYGACVAHKVGKCTGDLRVVHNTCLRNEQPGDSRHMGFVLVDLLKT